MVADLEGKLPAVAVLQEGEIAAVLLSAITDLWDADPLPIKAAQMGQAIYVQPVPQGEQSVYRHLVFLAKPHLSQTPFQTIVADIVRFSFADHSQQRFADQAVHGQCVGQYRQIFHLDGVLQGNAGGGNQDRPDGPALVGAEAVKGRSRRQIGVSFSDAGASVAQRDGAVQQGVQHQVAEGDLLGIFSQHNFKLLQMCDQLFYICLYL